MSTSSLQNGLVSYWKADQTSGNLVDSVGSNTGTNNNTVTFAAGKLNNCAVFNGSNQNFSVGTSLFTSYTGLTINLWVNLDIIDTFQGFMWKSDDTTYSIGLRVTDANKISAQITTGTETGITANTSLTTATWYMATVNYDGANINLYLNAAVDATAVPKTGNLKTSADTVYLGSQVNNTYLDGKLDEVGVWSRALTETEIKYLWAMGGARQVPFAQAGVSVF